MTYGRQELITHVMKQAILSKEDAQSAIDAIFSGITSALQHKEKVLIAGFGVFVHQHLPQRQGRNPRTGESVEIAAKNRASFKAGLKLRQALNAPQRSDVNRPKKGVSSSRKTQDILKQSKKPSQHNIQKGSV